MITGLYGMRTCRKPTIFKVTRVDRQQKKLVSASTVKELIRKGKTKRHIH